MQYFPAQKMSMATHCLQKQVQIPRPTSQDFYHLAITCVCSYFSPLSLEHPTLKTWLLTFDSSTISSNVIDLEFFKRLKSVCGQGELIRHTFPTKLHGNWENVLPREENWFKTTNKKEGEMYNFSKRKGVKKSVAADLN